MKRNIDSIAYISVTRKQFSRIAEDADCWASGEDNLCMTFESASEVPSLAKLLTDCDAMDVVVYVEE